jgi:2-polyprenyl-3-methyl-5-hydroxy-6-metoxy-1,4-benzoquinol methylase
VRVTDLNRRWWDERVPLHVESAFYDVDAFRAGTDPPHSVWALDEVGDVNGLDVVHLQCHFGMDTLALARRGARVTGLDFSGPAVDQARALAAELGIEATFVQADVHDAVAALGRTYDVVFTGIGALNWLPSVDRWTRVVASLLRPGGFLYLAEIHPFSLVFADGEQRIAYPYREHEEPTLIDEPGTYADREAPTVHNRTTEWNHGIGEIVTALIDGGLVLEFLHERVETFYDSTGWLAERSPGRWGAPEGELPLLYSLRARKAS